jgi:polyvinyl alcohol dehydrogenase (cytochrome)
MKRAICTALLVITNACGLAGSAFSADTAAPASAPPAGTELGFLNFQTKCMNCHGNPIVERAPTPAAIREMSPERIYEALSSGVMKAQGDSLTDEEKRTLALFMSGRPLGSAQQGDAMTMPNRCAANLPLADPAAGPAWNGWGVDVANSRFQSTQAAGLTIDQVPNLKLQWAFGYPTGLSAYGQPSVVSGRVFVGTDIGYVYSLDAATGCVYWSYQTKGSVRNAISVGAVHGHASAKYAAYFGDSHANVYAVDAQNGALLWMKHVDDHFTARITAAPTLHGRRLFVSVSSSEEFSAASLDYSCCTARGSVLALDASSGEQLWKTYTVGEPQPTRRNSKGVQLYAPAGVSVWNSPTVDSRRGAIYVGTGDSDTPPASKLSDSVIALDMRSGRLLWSFQAHANDAYVGGCETPSTVENCPPVNGPDIDVGSSPILRTLPSGRRILVAATKAGRVFALDPDKQGTLLWSLFVATNEPGTRPEQLNGVVWGGAADHDKVYYGLSNGPVVAIELASGRRVWTTTFEKGGERVSRAAAASAIPGAVFVGGSDGILHALSTIDGRELWSVETARPFATVNRVSGKGGAFGAPGPTLVAGRLFVGSGYGVTGAGSGNVLLAFGPE